MNILADNDTIIYESLNKKDFLHDINKRIVFMRMTDRLLHRQVHKFIGIFSQREFTEIHNFTGKDDTYAGYERIGTQVTPDVL